MAYAGTDHRQGDLPPSGHYELMTTGGIITNDEELIPTSDLKQARVALETAAQDYF